MHPSFETKLVLLNDCLQGSISPTFYEQLLHGQIPNAQKDSQVINVFFELLGSTSIKAACKTLMKLLNLTQNCFNQ
jgi:hypothetical protein